MNTKIIILFGAFVLIALVIALPKQESLFAGILITYIGFIFLNMYPFNQRFHLPAAALPIILFAAVGCIGYGWGSIIYNSHGSPPGIIFFLGALLLLISFTGWVLCLGDWFSKIAAKGLFAESVSTDGVYALVRHPQVLFSLLLLIGIDLYFWSNWLAMTTPLWIIGFVSYAALEEKMELVPRFEDEYLSYCDTTPGIFPNRSSIAVFMKQYE